MNEPLRPCPMCGGEPVVRQVVRGTVWSVECKDVLHTVSIMNWRSDGAARADWNKRFEPEVEA